MLLARTWPYTAVLCRSGLPGWASEAPAGAISGQIDDHAYYPCLVGPALLAPNASSVQANVTAAPSMPANVTAAPCVPASITATPIVQDNVTAAPSMQASVTAAPSVQANVSLPRRYVNLMMLGA